MHGTFRILNMPLSEALRTCLSPPWCENMSENMSENRSQAPSTIHAFTFRESFCHMRTGFHFIFIKFAQQNCFEMARNSPPCAISIAPISGSGVSRVSVSANAATQSSRFESHHLTPGIRPYARCQPSVRPSTLLEVPLKSIRDNLLGPRPYLSPLTPKGNV